MTEPELRELPSNLQSSDRNDDYAPESDLVCGGSARDNGDSQARGDALLDRFGPAEPHGAPEA